MSLMGSLCPTGRVAATGTRTGAPALTLTRGACHSGAVNDERLRTRATTADRGRFAGRRDALAVLSGLLDPLASARILVVHGPGGIGKSALLREAQRLAELAGRPVLTFDGRSLASALSDLQGALTPPTGAQAPLIIIDEVEFLGANIVAVREVLLNVLPADARIIVAGRQRPDRSWLAGMLEGMTLDLALRPLNDAESRELLARRGVLDHERQDAILAWAAGSPLALTLAATTRMNSPTVDDVGERLIEFLAGTEIDGVDSEVLEVAALSWAVDARLLASALPGRSTRGSLADLLTLSIVEQLGHRAVLHPLVGQALAARLRVERPQHYRALRARIAAHLKGRALQGDPQGLLELTNLIEDPAVRVGAGLHASRTHSAAGVRRSDVTGLAIEATAGPWWRELQRWIDKVPEFTTKVRRTDGSLAGIAMFVPGDQLPDGMENDPAVRPVLEHMAANDIDPARTLIGIAPHTAEPGDPELIEIVRVSNAIIVTRTGIVNPRYLYGIFWTDPTTPTQFLASMGYERVDSLARELDRRPLETWLADFGVGGLIGLIDSMVAAENGITVGLSDEDLIGALRDYRDDAAMALRDPAGNPEASRERVRDAIAASFDDGAHDQRLKRALELAHLGPALGEADILTRLHLSRATYYRHLREARQRLVGRG